MFDRRADDSVVPTLAHNSLRMMWQGLFDQEMADAFVGDNLMNTSRFWTKAPLAMGGKGHFYAALFVLYGEPLMKYTGVRASDSTAHGHKAPLPSIAASDGHFTGLNDSKGNNWPGPAAGDTAILKENASNGGKITV